MKKGKRLLALLLCLLLWIAAAPTFAEAAEERIGIVDVDYTLNVRSGPGTGYSRIDSLANGAIVTIKGESYDASGNLWYFVAYTSGGVSNEGYIIAQYVVATTVGEDEDFEAYLDQQKFPESYREGLRVLHALYPNWKFVAIHTNLEWSDVLEAECQIGRNLVSSSSPGSWINKNDVDSSGRQIARDGSGWVQASDALIAYSLDPRNFLSDPYILMFESLTYVPDLHSKEGVEKILNGTFMANGYTDSTGTHSYADAFMDAAEKSNVSPYHLAARVRMEQGTTGTLLTSGKVSGYYGYYNFFNVGAYTTSTASSSVNGAIYASSGTTYNRPWDSPYKAIVGGATYLGSGYINKGQDTMYTEKFNVTNRSSGLYYHQYMTSVTAPADEASTLKKAYDSEVLQSALLFKIPVYNNMPSTPVEKPTGNGSSSLQPSNPGTTTPTETPTDTPAVTPSVGSGTELDSAVYTLTKDGYITGVTEQTSASSLLSKVVGPSDSTVKLYGANGTEKSGKDVVGTGDQVVLLNSKGKRTSVYVVVIYGDVDGNGTINTLDLLRVQKHLLGTVKLTGANLLAADVNRDGGATTLDLLRVQKHLLGTQAIRQ